MVVSPVKWIRVHINKITQSIAFYPALIAISFLFLSWGMLELDFSPWGKQLKQQLSWLSLKDASTARTIISTVGGAIISLTVFSFSMVMIVLNQAASQMSNRVLSSMIENRFQQIILGCYIGTIVYALFLLSTIRDINSGVYVPALSIYLLILLTVVDIFLFIYFLDYVTQTLKYENVIHRVQQQTRKSMEEKYSTMADIIPGLENMPFVELAAKESNYYQGFSTKKLLALAEEYDLFISFACKPGDFILKGTVYIKVYFVSGNTRSDWEPAIDAFVDFYRGQPIQRNPEYGFLQLAEIALKSLSPGINDPATAVLSLHALSDLLAYRLSYYPAKLSTDINGVSRVCSMVSSFQDLFIKCIHPIWNYGKQDQYIQNELLIMINALKERDLENCHTVLLNRLLTKVGEAKKQLPANEENF